MGVERTINYYNLNAESFFQETSAVDVSAIRDRFLAFLPSGSSILDVGSGSGRDSFAFASLGYRVTAIEPSKELAILSWERFGVKPLETTIQDFKTDSLFDGVWACASLLHLPVEEVLNAFRAISNFLRPNGVFYVSFKYGNGSGVRNGRLFCDFTPDSLTELCTHSPKLSVQDIWLTNDARPERAMEQWTNALFLRV